MITIAPSLTYPRLAGSSRVVRMEDLCLDAPFGHCPACGSLGIERLADANEEDISFYCCDSRCKIVAKDRPPTHTTWCCAKSPELFALEAAGSSWNQQHFPNIVLPFDCPD